MNLFAAFRRLQPPAPILRGTVASVATGTALVELVGSGAVRVRNGIGAVAGNAVLLQDGELLAVVPSVTVVTIDI